MGRWIPVLVIVLGVCGAAWAQGADPGPSFDPFQPPVTLAEGRRLAEDAGLGAEGRSAATELVRGTNSVLERLGARTDRALERPNLEGRLDTAMYYAQYAERLRQ